MNKMTQKKIVSENRRKRINFRITHKNWQNTKTKHHTNLVHNDSILGEDEPKQKNCFPNLLRIKNDIQNHKIKSKHFSRKSIVFEDREPVLGLRSPCAFAVSFHLFNSRIFGVFFLLFVCYFYLIRVDCCRF